MDQRHHLLTILGAIAQGSILPLNVNFADYPDGALPPVFTGATWSVSGGKAENSPTLSGLSSDPTLEGTYTGGLNTVLASTGGTVAQSATAHSPTKAQQHTPNAVNQRVYLAGKNSVNNTWYKARAWLQRVSGASNNVAFNAFNSGQKPENAQSFAITNSSYEEKALSFLAGAVGLMFAGTVSSSGSADSVVMDDLDIYPLTFSELFAWLPATQADVILKIVPNTNWIDDTHFGMVLRASDTLGTNLIYVLVFTYAAARSSYIRYAVITKVGTTQNVRVSPNIVAIVSGAWFEARVTGDTLGLYYNDVLLSSYTLVDNELLSGQYHALFSAGGQQIERFFAAAS